MLRACLLWGLLCTGLCKENIFIFSLRDYQPTLATLLAPLDCALQYLAGLGSVGGPCGQAGEAVSRGPREGCGLFRGAVSYGTLPSQPVVKSLRHPKY